MVVESIRHEHVPRSLFEGNPWLGFESADTGIVPVQGFVGAVSWPGGVVGLDFGGACHSQLRYLIDSERGQHELFSVDSVFGSLQMVTSRVGSLRAGSSLPGPQGYAKQRPKTSEDSLKGHCFTYARGPG